MEIALGIFMWPPARFWRSTLHEFNAAYDGYLESKGLGSKNVTQPLSRAEMMALEKKLG